MVECARRLRGEGCYLLYLSAWQMAKYCSATAQEDDDSSRAVIVLRIRLPYNSQLLLSRAEYRIRKASLCVG